MSPVVAKGLFSLGSTVLSNILSRGDYNYTHRMESIPQQVREMHEAGLNPALAYGQISPAQGQSLGNYQSDFSDVGRLIQDSGISKEMEEHQRLENDILRANAEYIKMKTRNEALMLDFDRTHQQDRFNVEIEGKGLANVGQRIQNYGYQLDNKNKLVQNEILGLQKDIEEFNRQMKSIDVSRHADYVDAEIQRILSSTALSLKEAWALGQKVPVEVEQIQQATRNLERVFDEMGLNGQVNRQLTREQIEQLKKTNEYQELENSYKKWLSRDPRVRSMIEHAKGSFESFIMNMFVTPAYRY